MIASVADGGAFLALAGCFFWFAIASYRHFDPASHSLGNAGVRVLTLAASVWLTIQWASSAPVAVAFSLIALLWAGASLAVFRSALRSAEPGLLHVAFTGDGPDKLVTGGIYARLRNPLYTAYLAYWLGWVALSALNWLSLGVFALFLTLYAFAIWREERFLSAGFGRVYDDYRAQTGRFLPRLGPERTPQGD